VASLADSEKIKLLERLLKSYLFNKFSPHTVDKVHRDYSRILWDFTLEGEEEMNAYFEQLFVKLLADYINIDLRAGK